MRLMQRMVWDETTKHSKSYSQQLYWVTHISNPHYGSGRYMKSMATTTWMWCLNLWKQQVHTVFILIVMLTPSKVFQLSVSNRWISNTVLTRHYAPFDYKPPLTFCCGGIFISNLRWHGSPYIWRLPISVQMQDSMIPLAVPSLTLNFQISYIFLRPGTAIFLA